MLVGGDRDELVPVSENEANNLSLLGLPLSTEYWSIAFAPAGPADFSLYISLSASSLTPIDYDYVKPMKK